MKIYWWIPIVLFFPVMASAQVSDDFSDGDFTANPAWIGTDTSFKVNNSYQLQSNATSAGEAWIALDTGRNAECSLRHIVVSPAGRYAVPQGFLRYATRIITRQT